MEQMNQALCIMIIAIDRRIQGSESSGEGQRRPQDYKRGVESQDYKRAWGRGQSPLQGTLMGKWQIMGIMTIKLKQKETVSISGILRVFPIRFSATTPTVDLQTY